MCTFVFLKKYFHNAVTKLIRFYVIVNDLLIESMQVQ